MYLSRLAVKRPVTIFMIVLIILLLGTVSLSRLGLDLFPDMELPYAVVITSYDGAGPEEIETLVTRPIEEAVASVDNVQEVMSVSREGLSMVQVGFTWGTDMDYASLDIREQVGFIEAMLPSDAGDPIVFQFDPAMMPIKVLTLSGPQGEAELRKIAEDVLKPRLERLEGVASVGLAGGLEREIRVRLDPVKLHGYGISADSVVSSLGAQNVNRPGGTVEQSRYEYLVRTMGEFTSMEDIQNVLITAPTGGSVRLGELALVEDGYSDINQKTFMNGQAGVGIALQKQSGTNTVMVAETIEKEVTALERDLPHDTSITTVMDQSVFITGAIENIGRNAAVGALFAVFVIYFFLRNFRSTFIIATAIPISIIATFILIHFGGLTLNLMTMGGLALGVGMLVDNAIVVLENIYRHRQQGGRSGESAVKGASEVANAIIASTLTTMAVFLPIVFVEGLASQIFSEFAMTVAFALLASLAVSLSFIPMLSSKMAVKIEKENSGEANSKVREKILESSKAFQNRLTNFYRSVLEKVLRFRLKVVVGVTAIFIASLMLIPFVGAEFIPRMDTGEFEVEFELAHGASLSETEDMGRRLESIIMEYDEVEHLYLSIGAGSMDIMLGTEGQSNVGQIYANIGSVTKRDISIDQMIEELRQRFSEIPGLDSSITAEGGMPLGDAAPVSIEIKGDEFEVLEELGRNITSLVESVEGTREVTFSMEEGRPEVQVVVDRDKASSYGLTSSQIAGAVRTSLTGSVASLYREDGDEINIRVESLSEGRRDMESVRSLLIGTPGGTAVPLSAVADFKMAEGPTSITRDNQIRSAYVNADITGRDLGSINEEIMEKVDELILPEGYTVDFGGEMREMMDAFGDLTLALLLAVVLVYMIMAAQFESLMHPFVIMFTLPLAVIGVVLGLFVTGRTFNVPAFIGVIMLAGIVVNNAIVMVDYINQLRRSGMNRREAILEAAPIRLRPILMTALTTILAMLPLAIGIGEGAEVQAPLATVVVAGLIFSAFLTLIVIPVVYTFMDDFGGWLKRNIIKGLG